MEEENAVGSKTQRRSLASAKSVPAAATPQSVSESHSDSDSELPQAQPDSYSESESEAAVLPSMRYFVRYEDAKTKGCLGDGLRCNVWDRAHAVEYMEYTMVKG
jgi:hypothetical protein